MEEKLSTIIALLEEIRNLHKDTAEFRTRLHEEQQRAFKKQEALAENSRRLVKVIFSFSIMMAIIILTIIGFLLLRLLPYLR